MTPENRIQTTEWLGDLYRHFLWKISQSRGIDTATLQRLANTGAIQTPQDAVSNKLIDGVKYDDQVKDEIKKHLKLDKYDKINYISINTYSEPANFRQSGSSRIALFYDEGNIIDGKGDTTCALMGAIMVNACKQLGIAGIVMDAALRDSEDIV